jgi:hypothetical protein
VEDGKVFVNGKEVTGTIDLNAGGKKIRIDGTKVFIDGKDVTAIPRGSVRTITETDSGTREEVRVQVIRAGDGKELMVAPVPPVPAVPPTGHLAPLPPVPPLPVAPMMRFEGVGKLGKGTTTSLGTKDFDGVRAEGKQTVWTIPAGEIGNRAPINVTAGHRVLALQRPAPG